MATFQRGYLPSSGSGPAGATPAFDGNWNTTTGAIRRLGTTTKGSTAIAASATISMASGSAGQSAACAQFFYGPLAAQTILSTITFKAQIAGREFATSDNVDTPLSRVFVCDATGGNVRDLFQWTAAYGTNPNEWINNASHRNVTFSTDANSAAWPAGDVTVDDGDYLVWEFGGQNSVAGTSPQFALKLGENATDLPENDTTTSDGAGWIEFSDPITLQTGVQEISAAGAIATAEAFGTAKLNMQAVPSGIATAEAFGTTTLRLHAVASGIATGEAHGSLALNLIANLTGIASAEAFGTSLLRMYLLASAIASEEAHGGPSVQPNISPSGIASEETHGSPQLNLTAFPASTATAEAFGTTVLLLYLLASSIATAEAFGDLTFTLGAAPISPTGIASGEAHGTTVLTHLVAPGGIASVEAHGQGQLNLIAFPAGKTSDEAFGTLTAVLYLLPSSIASDEAFGALIASVGGSSIFAAGIASAEAHGDPTLTSIVSLLASAIASDEAFGNTALGLRAIAEAIASDEAFGTPLFVVQLAPSSIGSEEAHGTAALAALASISPSGIASDEAHGSLTLRLELRAISIDGAEAFGVALLRATIVAGGLSSEEAFGLVALTQGAAPGVFLALVTTRDRPHARIVIASRPHAIVSTSDLPFTRIRTMADFDIYDVGDTARVRATFTVDGVPTDPTATSVEVKPPGSAKVTYTYPSAQLVKISAGVFEAVVDLTEGSNDTPWLFFFVGTGAAKGTELHKLMVRPRPV